MPSPIIGTCSCGRQWRGVAEAHCRTCCAHFKSVSGFDEHRRNGTCADPATLTRRDGGPAFRLDDHGRWTLAYAGEHPMAARRRGANA